MAKEQAGEVTVVLNADSSKLDKGLKGAGRRLEAFGKNARAVGMKMSAGITLPLVGAAAAAIKTASDFEASMTKIQSLVGLSAQTVQGFKSDVLALSGETARAPKELADAMFFITSAGLRGSDAVEALEASAKAAAVGMGETEVVADAVTNAINGYGTEAMNASLATDILVKTVEQGKAAASDLAPQFGRLIPMAAELGVSFDQVGAGLAFLTRSSGDAAQSSTMLGGILKALIKPSGAARKNLDEIGFSLHEFRKAAGEDLLAALIEMRQKLEANGKEMSDVIEDARALGGALQLTGVQAGQAREVFDALSDSAGALDRGFKIVQQTTQFKMQKAMTTLKASMVTLGEKVIPVVVPAIAAVAAVIGNVSQAFGNLNPTIQTLIIATAGIAAAVGPVIMAFGMMTAAVGALGLALGPVTLAMAAVAVVGAALVATFVDSQREAKIVADRQKELTDAFVASGDEAHTLVDRLGDLIVKYGNVKAELDGTKEAVEGFEGAALLMGLALERDVATAMANLGIETDVLEEALRSGGAGMEGFYNIAKQTKDFTEQQMLSVFSNFTGATGEVGDALVEAYRSGIIPTREALIDLTSVLMDVESAYKDDTAAVEAAAMATLGIGDAIEGVTDQSGILALAVGGDVVAAHIAAAEKTGNWSGELEKLRVKTDKATFAMQQQVREAHRMETQFFGGTEAMEAYEEALSDQRLATMHALYAEGKYEEALEFAANAMAFAEGKAERLAAREREAATETGALSLTIADMNANIAAGLDPLGRTAEVLGEITAQAAGADQALLAFAKENTDAAKNRAHWVAVVAAQRAEQIALEEAIADEEARQVELIREAERALQDQKDALQANINVQEEALENAEAHLAALEAQAEAAKKPVQALKDRAAAEREGFDALRGMWQAQNDLADATQTVADIEAELAEVRAGGGEAIKEAEAAWAAQVKVGVGHLRDKEDALARALDLTGQIADLTEERLFIEQKGGDFQRELLHNLNQQLLAYHDITASVEQLEGRQEELSAGAIQSQKDLVASLRAEQAAITEVEQALIDLGIVSATDAAQAAISAKQAKNLIKLRDELADIETQVEAGEATLLDLIEAQDDYNKAVTDARRPIDKLERATENLARMEEDAERIGLQLAVARDKQTMAQEALTAAQETGARTAEAVAEVDRELIKLKEAETQATIEAGDAHDAWTDAMLDAEKIRDTSAVQLAEEERLIKELEVANWDLVASQYGVQDAEIALAEAGDKVNDAIDRMTAISPALAAEMITMSEAARGAYPQFDTMRANLAVLEPQIASAKSAVDGFRDAIAALVREMAILNGTRVNPIQVPNLPPLTGSPSGDGGGGGGSPAAAAIVAAVDEVAAAVEDVVDAVDAVVAVVEPGGALLDGDEFKALINATVDDNADAILGIQEAAALEKFLGNISAYDIPEMPVYMPKVATPSTYGSIGGPGSRGGGIPSAAAGGFVQSAGLVNVHAGETITPRGGGVNIVVNVEGSVSSERDLVESIRKGLLQAQKSGKAVVL